MTIEYKIENLNQIALEIFNNNKEVGWWDDINRCIHTTIMLIVTEVAEATEGERKNLMDDHLPHRKMGEVELADAGIRTLDLGGRFYDILQQGRQVIEIIAKEASDPELIKAGKTKTIGLLHLTIVGACTHFADTYTTLQADPNSEVAKINFAGAYDALLGTIIYVANVKGYDIFGAMKEKVEYNKTRLDHKREERAKDNGKAF